jgi:outer membrane protein OmpA-like peptidoglycan-associated protein
MKLNTIMATALALIVVSPGGATQVQQREKEPIYTITINVVDRTTKAVNYQHRSGATKIDFRGTALLPLSHGEAKVETKQGYTEIEVEFRNLQAATRFGPEFLTYVMWSITPEGRATNLGEVLLNGTSSKLDVTTELQAFGLIVTAEPYFGVTQPSDAVVMENFVRADTLGKVEEIEAKYELLQRGHYTVNVMPAELKPMVLDKTTPLDLYEARNAVRIARWAGADVSASDSYQKASKLLAQAEAAKTSNSGSKAIAESSRAAVQTAEDSRLITLKIQAEARLAKERDDSANREAAAKQASAVREATANAAAAEARAEAIGAERARASAQAQTDRARLDAQSAAQRATDDAKAQAERTRLDTELAAQRTANDRRAAEAASQLAMSNATAQAARDKQAAETANELALKNAAAQAEKEKQELRSKLIVQLNAILQTQDSARGLIVNMSDVLFDTGQFSLKPGAREKLSKISGIVLAYPTLKLEVEGHTDSVGADASNMTLSQSRSDAVRDFLVKQGVVSSISSTGFGESQPVATNDTAAGRQQNRRVELVVSGDVIGSGQPIQAKVQ